MKRQIVNIINFIRAVEPRVETDLVTPVLKQIELLKAYGFKGTFLLQYDALIEPVYQDILKELDSEQFELGIWLEIVEPLTKKAGIKWTGRFPWDWHAHCGFSVGYTLKQRELMADIIMEDFKAVFGCYPKVMGSWAFDAHTLKYLNDKYGLDAACNCKEQWGTDGYTLWGGYYNQGYYPSAKNVYCPASTEKQQINVPVFRMLGSDPIYQYDVGLDLNTGASERQSVVTLEPVYTGTGGGGGEPVWVDWYLDTNFNGDCLSFGYAQVGQENSFGWDSMKDGLAYQFKKLKELQEQGRLEIETLGETGRWYKSTFPMTPASAVTAYSDWLKTDKRSVWFNCKNYRINLYADKKTFWIRDIYVFNEDYPERYRDEVCTEDFLQFDNLPVMDGNRWSGNKVRAGLYPCKADGGDSPLTFTDMKYSEKDGIAEVVFAGTEIGNLSFCLCEDKIRITADKNFKLCTKLNRKAKGLPEAAVKGNEVQLTHRGFEYKVKALLGRIDKDFNITSEGGTIELTFPKTESE